MATELRDIPHWDLLLPSRYCLDEWKRILGKHFAMVQPLLVKCVGEIAKSYPDPDTGLRLLVREYSGGYVAHPVGDFEGDSQDYLLKEADVQLWRINGAQTEARQMKKVPDRTPQTPAPEQRTQNATIIGDEEARPRFRPTHNWSEVVMNGETISLRNREKAKDFLRLLWDKGATRRSEATAAGKRFAKPSSLFRPGERYVRDANGPAIREVPVGSERGEMILRVYSDAVGKVPPAKKGKGPTKYYLRVFADSDST